MQAGLDQFPQPKRHWAQILRRTGDRKWPGVAAQVENPHGESRCQSVGGHDRDAEVANGHRVQALGLSPEVEVGTEEQRHPGSTRDDRTGVLDPISPAELVLGIPVITSRLRGGSPGFTLNITLAMAEFASATAAIRSRSPADSAEYQRTPAPIARPSSCATPSPARCKGSLRARSRPRWPRRVHPRTVPSTRQPARRAASATAGSGFAFIE